ncbi:hypothetical protein ADK64_17785 [Streptomyces sp. MMG1121]|nr:hypothetical protein ADK64_17785 [Streptomyces sp. MMG1121]
MQSVPAPAAFGPTAPTRYSGGTKRQTPQEVVAAALKALDRRTPPPITVSGRRNSVMATLGRAMSRRRAVLVMGSATAR